MRRTIQSSVKLVTVVVVFFVFFLNWEHIASLQLNNVDNKAQIIWFPMCTYESISYLLLGFSLGEQLENFVCLLILSIKKKVGQKLC